MPERCEDWALRTVTASPEIRLEGWWPAGEQLLRNDDGRLLWIVNPPTRRERMPGGPVSLDQVDWTLTQTDQGVILRASAAGAFVDLVELGREAGEAFLTDRSEPLMLPPLAASVSGPWDLAQYLVGEDVAATADGRAWSTEQVALSLYRIARLRGGRFWDAVADHLAGAVATRVERAGNAGPAQGFWGKGETHVRLLADAVLLLSAHAELSSDPRIRRAATLSADQLAGYGVPWGGGTWYLHDSLERESERNDLVLNTHIRAMLALNAAGRPDRGAYRAVETALALRSRRPGAYVHAAAIAACDGAAAWAPGPGFKLARRGARAAHAAAARYRSRNRHLRAPGGFLARDVGGQPPDSRYLVINLFDLATLSANGGEERCQGEARAGFRYAEASGYLRAEWRRGDPIIAALYPSALRITGRGDAAFQAADRALARGWLPAVGWPGYEDALWSSLAPGTP